MSKAFNTRDRVKQSLSDQLKAEMAEWEAKHGPIKTIPAKAVPEVPRYNGKNHADIGKRFEGENA